GADPILAHDGRFALRVAPARRFADHTARELVRARRITRQRSGRRERAAVEEMLLHVVRSAQTELGIRPKALPNVLRIALAEAAAGGRIAYGDKLRAVEVYVTEAQLGIVREEAKTFARVAIARSKEVVWKIVLINGPIEVAHVDGEQHVVDEIIHIEQHFVSGIWRAVSII